MGSAFADLDGPRPVRHDAIRPRAAGPTYPAAFHVAAWLVSAASVMVLFLGTWSIVRYQGAKSTFQDAAAEMRKGLVIPDKSAAFHRPD